MKRASVPVGQYQANIYAIDVPEGRRERQKNIIFQELMVEKFPNLMKTVNP